jgi:PAS domain S-box-containing protein
VAIALGLKLLLNPLIQAESPFLIFFTAVIVSALAGGWRAGFTATLLAAAIANYLFFTPFYAFNFSDFGQNLRLLLFVLEGGFISWVLDRLTTLQQRLKAEQEALQSSQAQYRQLVESVQDYAIFLLDRHGTVTSWNTGSQNLKGYRAEEIIGQPYSRFYPLEAIVAGKPELHLETAASLGQFEEEDWRVRQDGSRFWASVTLTALRDATGNLHGFSQVTRDITDRKLSSDALRDAYTDLEERVQERTAQLAATNQALQQQISERQQAEHTLRSFFDSASMMMGIVELVGNDIRHLTDNAAAARFFARSAKQMQSQLASQLGAPAAHIQTWLHHYREAERTQAPVRFEYPHHTPTEERWLSATVCPLAVSPSQPARFAYIVEDITDRKQAAMQLETTQWALRQLNAELEQRVQQRTAELEATNRQLAQEICDRQAAEQELAQSEQRFRLLAETMPQIVWTALPDGSVDYYNQRWTEFSGIPVAAGQGWDWQPVLHPEDQQRTIDAWTQAVQTGHLYECEHRVQRADGEFRWHLSRGLPLRNEQGEIIKWFGTATDIHEQKQIQAALSQSEQRFRLAVDNIPDAFVIYDADRRIQFINAEGLRRTQQRLEEFLGCKDEEIFPPEITSAYLPTLERAIASRTIQTTECTTTLPTFGTHTTIVTYVPLLNPQGELAQILGIAHDITERKRAEEALRLSAERFRIALQHSPIAVFNQDQELRYTWIHNPKLGYAATEVLGKTDTELMPAGDAAELSQIKRQVMATGVGCRQEVRTSSQEGNADYFDLTVEPLRNDSGEVVGITAAAIDITNRKHIEAELRTRAQQQAAIADLGQQALSSSNLDDFMAAAIRLIAQTLEVEYAKVLELLPPGDHLRLRWGVGWPASLVGQAIVSADPTSQAGYTLAVREPIVVSDLRQETRFTGPDLLHDHGIISGMSVAIAGQPQPFGVLGIHSTQPRPFTQDDVHFLQAAANILAETIQRQRSNETLQQQSAALAQANRLKDEFLATISHELRTPLNAMLGWIKLLPTRQFDPVTTMRAIEVIARNTQTLAQVIEDVLDMSDIIRGQLNLQIEPVDLALVIEQAIATINLAAQAKQIRVESHLDAGIGWVLGDATRLQQIVWNLLSNAVKFTPNGGQVNVHLDCIDQKARIQVSDNGQGIHPDFLPFVFDRFRQEDNSITRTHGGLGLGLAIVRYLVELHGGTVRAESPGSRQGATFIVLLPIAPVQPPSL